MSVTTIKRQTDRKMFPNAKSEKTDFNGSVSQI